MTVPLACSLDGPSAGAQGEAWRALLADVALELRWCGATHVEMLLRVEASDLEAIVRLSQAETKCCPFFRFSLRIEVSELLLNVTVDADAASLLETFITSITNFD